MPLASGIITFFRSEGSPDRGYYVPLRRDLRALPDPLLGDLRVQGRGASRALPALGILERPPSPEDAARHGGVLRLGLRNGPFWFLLGVLVYRPRGRN
jgi:hypothetical protein